MAILDVKDGFYADMLEFGDSNLFWGMNISMIS